MSFQIKEIVERKAGPSPEEIAAHVLSPGDLVWILNLAAPDPLAVAPLGTGVVAKSRYNTGTELEVYRGGEPLLQSYPVKQLRWMGEE